MKSFPENKKTVPGKRKQLIQRVYKTGLKCLHFQQSGFINFNMNVKLSAHLYAVCLYIRYDNEAPQTGVFKYD